MSVNAGGKIAMVVGVLLCLAGCSKQDPVSTRFNPNSGAAGAGDTKPGDKDDKPSEPSGPLDTDNPAELPPPSTVADAGQDKDPMMSQPDAGDGCEVGKFCAPKEPDSNNCGKLDLKTNTKTIDKPGNVLVVFDRSGSMEADWNGTPKYQAAGNALIAAVTPIKDLVTMAGMFFPSAPTMGDTNCPMGCNVADPIHWIPGPGACCLNGVAGSCDVNTIDQPDQIDFSKADDFITRLPMQWHLAGATGTPLQLGVERAAAAISSKMFADPLIVIVMTDGEPNCNTDPAMVLSQITAWKAAGIATHVVGLPGAQAAADTLNMIAQAGGTDKYIDPADPMELENRLRTVISSTVKTGFESCTFELEPKAEVPEKLHLIVTQNGMEADVARDLSKDAHWSINGDGNKVELEGQLCDLAKDGTFERIRFVFGCVDTPPLDPPPPPMLN
jgi:hypothetical protein